MLARALQRDRGQKIRPGHFKNVKVNLQAFFGISLGKRSKNRNPLDVRAAELWRALDEKSRLCLHIVNKFRLCSTKRCKEGGLCGFVFGVETNGSSCSPGNDLCGLNDGGVSFRGETRGIQEHVGMFRLFHFYLVDTLLI